MVSEQEMYPYVRSVLRARFPYNEGWRIFEQDHWGSYIPDFVIEKRTRDYLYRIPVEVKASCRATRSHVNQVNQYARNLSGLYVKIYRKILIYPSGADTSAVPSDINVILLRKFRCR